MVPLLNGCAAELPCGRAHARHPRTTFSFLLPPPYFRVHSCPLVVLLLSLSCFSCFSWFPTSMDGRARARHPRTTFSILLPSPYLRPSTHYPLLSSPSSLLSCPFVSIRGSVIIPFVLFVLFVVPFLLDGSPLQSVHALPSPFFSLFPTFYSNPEKMHYIL